MPIPITVLTGFLGAGKTTLLQYLLQAEHGLRLAVIENEFSPAPIDAELLGTQPVSVTTLANGCVCCSIQGELEKALLVLLEKQRAGLLAFDRVVIECTGLADPAPIAQSILTTPDLSEGYQLDCIVTLVDALHAEQHLTEVIAQAQVGFADVLLLSKTDLVSPEQLERLRERLQRINRRAPQVLAKQGQVELDQVLGVRGFELEAPFTGLKPLWRRSDTALGDRVQTLLIEAGELPDTQRLSAFFEHLLAQYGRHLLRYKGVIALKDEPARLLFQGVLELYSFDWGNAWAADEARRSVLVLIGDQLPEAQIRQAFADLACPISEVGPAR